MSEEAKFVELMTRQEELIPELAPYLVSNEHFQALKHPYIFGVPYMPQMNAMYNQWYRQKTELLEKCRDTNDYSRYIAVHERPWRLHAFHECASWIENDKEYWETLGWMWTDSENIWENADEWHELMTADRPFREHMMDEEDRATLQNLPHIITIYRGYVPLHDNLRGMSWTLDPEKAKWFSNRYGSEVNRGGRVAKMKVKKEQCIAYFGDRNEQEIVIDVAKINWGAVRR